MKKNLYIGGYSILDLNGSNVYKQALICAEQNKPVLVYDDPERYYADTIKIDTDNDDNVVITKGGKTITINDANAVSSVGDIQEKIYYYEIDMSDFKISGEDAYMDTDYCILISNINLNGLKYSELPIGRYALIAHVSQSQLSDHIPTYFDKASANSLSVYNNAGDSNELTIGSDGTFTQLI